MHLVTTAELDDLRHQIETQHGYRVATLDVAFDTFDFARTGANLVDRAVAYSTPSGDRIAGLGTAWRATANGDDRFDKIRRDLEDLDQPDLTAFVGFSFLATGPTSPVWDGFEAAEVFIPRISLQDTDTGTRLTVVVPPGESPEATLELLASMRAPRWLAVEDTGDHSIESHPHVTEWASSVATAVDAIRSGPLEKVVLARSVTVSSTEPVQILRVFRSIISRYPQCYNFAWKSGDAVFLGASPELLADVRGRRLASNPLAGSAKRGEGDEEDARIGEALLTSAKNRQEHRLVVEDLRARLGPLVRDLEVQNEPTVRKMATVQHLSTQLRATLISGNGVLDAVSAAHPTPAVGGVSRDDAVAFISRAEQIDRGWYTGGVGWINGRGEGSICIALRCGLVRGLTTHLFAGAGIVADSQPEAELAETRLKLRPMLELLTTS